MDAEMMPDETTPEETGAEIEADDARWDALLATEAAQLLLERLAEEALIEYRAGQTRSMIFAPDGHIAPGESYNRSIL